MTPEQKRPGWLSKQLTRNAESVSRWSKEMKEVAGFQDIEDQRDKRIADLEAVLRKLLSERPDCPFCDFGRLRNENKPHREDCGYLIANILMERS